MPANIAHVLIAQAAYEALRKENATAADLVLSKNNFFYLGSLGPDLPSYATPQLVKAALHDLLIRPFTDQTNPREEDASFFLHSTRPNMFPWYLMETNMAFASMRDGNLVVEEFNEAVFAFTMGYVSHIAADQIVHKLVREKAGPYYRNLETAQRHADCEVHQDIFLFHELHPKRALEKTFVAEMVNVDKLGIAYTSFCNFLSLSISKAGYERIDREDIDLWIDGIRLTFELMDSVGPYVGALKNYQKHRTKPEAFPKYREYFRDPATGFDYMDHYRRAVSLYVQYMREVASLWEAPVFSYDRAVAFQRVVHPEDLTSPYREDLLMNPIA